MIDVRLVGSESGRAVAVGPDGTIATAQVTPSNPSSITLATADGAHNFCKPVPGKEYRITDIILTTNKDIGLNGAAVVVYEAASAETETASKVVLSTQILKNSSLVLSGLHWKVAAGKFLNVKTDDDTVYCTIASHLVTAHDSNPAALGAGADV